MRTEVVLQLHAKFITYHILKTLTHHRLPVIEYLLKKTTLLGTLHLLFWCRLLVTVVSRDQLHFQWRTEYWRKAFLLPILNVRHILLTNNNFDMKDASRRKKENSHFIIWDMEAVTKSSLYTCFITIKCKFDITIQKSFKPIKYNRTLKP